MIHLRWVREEMERLVGFYGGQHCNDEGWTVEEGIGEGLREEDGNVVKWTWDGAGGVAEVQVRC